MTKLLIAFLFTFSLAQDNSSSDFRVRAFSCQSQHSIFDPEFVQGSEIYLDVFFYSNTAQLEIALDPADGPPFSLYVGEENTRAHYINQANVFAEWKNQDWSTYISMAYLGGPWGLATRVPDSYGDEDYAGRDIEVWCRETENTDQLLDLIEK